MKIFIGESIESKQDYLERKACNLMSEVAEVIMFEFLLYYLFEQQSSHQVLEADMEILLYWYPDLFYENAV